jgi:parallel beta-helix repeat protein
MEGVTAKNCDGQGLRLRDNDADATDDGVNYAVVERSRFLDNDLQGILINGVSYASFSENYFQGNTTCLKAEDAQYVHDITVSNNTFKQCEVGIVLQGDDSPQLTASNVTIVGNVLSDFAGGGSTEGGIRVAAIKNAVVSNNVIEDSDNYGIHVFGDVSNVTITGNTVIDTDVASAQSLGQSFGAISLFSTSSVIATAPQKVVISGNTISQTDCATNCTRAMTITENTDASGGDAADITVIGNIITVADGTGTEDRTVMYIRDVDGLKLLGNTIT